MLRWLQCPPGTSFRIPRPNIATNHMRLYGAKDSRPHRHGKTARGRLHQINNDKQLFKDTHQAVTRRDTLKLLNPLSSDTPQEFPCGSRAQTMVGQGRFELPTSRLSSARSNQLSY